MSEDQSMSVIRVKRIMDGYKCSVCKAESKRGDRLVMVDTHQSDHYYSTAFICAGCIDTMSLLVHEREKP
jgi:hypothetical protein